MTNSNLQISWVQLFEWSKVGVPIFQCAKEASGRFCIYTQMRITDEGVVGPSKKWPKAKVRPYIGLTGEFESWDYSEYQTDDEETFHSICASSIGYHGMRSIVSPTPISPDVVAELMPVWEKGDVASELVRLGACELAGSPWLYFLGFYYKHEANTLFLSSISEEPLISKIISYGKAVEDFDVYAVSVSRLKEMMS